jgi:predicted Zn-dependent protease
MKSADVLREAERQLRAGDILAAERTLATLWADTANAPGEALHLLGLIRRAQRRIRDAERYLRRAIAAQPDAPAHHAALGELLASVGLHAPALEAYGHALRLYPESSAAGLAYARSALEAHRPGEAEHAVRRVIAHAPTGEAWELLARALSVQDKLEEALAAIDEALKAQPQSFSAQIARANILARLGRNEEALALLDALSAQGRAAPALEFCRGAALFNLARPGEAEAAFAAGARRWPANAALQNALANARWMRGEGANFTRGFEAAVAAEPDNVRLRLACADLLRRADFRDRSEALLREGLTRAPAATPDTA